MRLKQRHTIGAKLVAAFSCSSLMLTIACLVAWGTWNQLDGQVESLLESNVPKYNLSYVLESRSSEIRRRVDLLANANNKVELEAQWQGLSNEIDKVKRALTDNDHLQSELQHFELFYQQLDRSVDLLANQVSSKIDHQRSIDRFREQLNWLHQDIATELTPLRQEYHWRIERNDSGEDTRDMLAILNTIQQVLDLENKVYAMLEEVISAPQKELVNNGLTMIHYRLAELNSLSTSIFAHPASIAYQQLINELTLVLKSDGEFHQLLLQNVALDHRLDQTNIEIDQRLESVHQQIAKLIVETDEAFVLVKQETTQMVSYGNHVLLVCFSLSILISLFLTYYFINKRIVGRLTRLSSSIDAIINDDFSHPIQVDGKDEIGRLSEKLIEYGDKVREIQRTNAISLINNTTASLVTCDRRGQIESANLSARQLLGLQTVCEPQKFWASFNAENQAKLRHVFTSYGQLAISDQESVTLALEGEERKCYLHFDFQLFSHANLQKVIVTITDVTQQTHTALQLEQLVAEKTRDLVQKNQQLTLEVIERKRAQLHLKDTQNELIQAAKMAVVGQTMTSLAHELNQPLNAMSTYVYSAQMFTEQGDISAVNHSINQISGLVGRMSKIIKNLRHFARKADGKQSQQQYPLAELVEQATILVSTKFKRQQVHIESDIPTDAFVWANDVSLEQVLVNLLVNGCDAVVESRQQEKQVNVCYLGKDGPFHRFAIVDNGTGFDGVIMDKLFSPFTTTKEVGLGLGLNICRSLIESNGGHIYLASSVDRGAMVVMELPSEQK
ncbi:ATP-binding protein [Vibrio scophthalmi]|uniref:ATP-binding protein n=1 Tax=Vibrio scophthalmi TaxID=45658 RepID=UPI003AAFD95E